MKKVILTHRWEGTPKSDWYPWFKSELESKGFAVEVPEMPNTNEPKIEGWVSKLQAIVPVPDEKTCFVGHSIGCQTILRYIGSLQLEAKVGNIVLVAPWTKLLPIILEEDGAQEIAKPWIKTPIDWEKVKSHCNNVTALFSTDDPYVYLEDQEIFREKLQAKIITMKNKGHFTEDTGVTKLPEILELIQL